MTGRDVQRAKVYDAEALVRTVFERADQHGVRALEVLGSQITLPVERKFASVESVQTYVDKVLALNWVRARWSRSAEPVRVRARAGNSAAHYSQGVLAVPLHVGGTAWALRELVILHELAHHLDRPDSTAAPHGPEFVGRYLELVSEIVGSEAAFLLRCTYLDCGVRL